MVLWIALVLVLAGIVAVPAASAEPGETVVPGPMGGKCIVLRGLTGLSVHVGSCLPHGHDE